MSETRVVNKYKEPYDVYIGRGSKWVEAEWDKM